MADAANGERQIGFKNASALKHQIYFYATPPSANRSDMAGMYDSTFNKGIWSYNKDGIMYHQALNTFNSNIRMPFNSRIYFGTEHGRIYSTGNQHLYFSASAEAGYFLHLGVHDSRWTLDPDVDNRLALGSPNHRYTNIFAVDPTVYSSDRNAKTDIKALPSIYEKVFFDLEPVAYRFKDGTSGRTHTGFISQDVETALGNHGLTTMDLAAVCKDKNESSDVYRYGLRYSEIVALNTHMIQKLYAEINELRARLESE